MERDPAVLKKVSVSLPFGLGSAEWEADQTERHAAWSLYVELVTRISIQLGAIWYFIHYYNSSLLV